MIRIIIREIDGRLTAHLGTPAHINYLTFEVEAPDVERFLASRQQFIERSVVGVEAHQAQQEGEGNG